MNNTETNPEEQVRFKCQLESMVVPTGDIREGMTTDIYGNPLMLAEMLCRLAELDKDVYEILIATMGQYVARNPKKNVVGEIYDMMVAHKSHVVLHTLFGKK